MRPGLVPERNTLLAIQRENQIEGISIWFFFYRFTFALFTESKKKMDHFVSH
jgi:hypothetical protein